MMNVAVQGLPLQRPIKCVVWDLDHTLWDGILAEGDEVRLRPGVAALIRQLDQRGVLHSIASKNDYAQAMAKLQDFGLAEYFLYPQISWSAKSVALGHIRSKLNLGIDALLFIDGLPFEREEVQAAHPTVQCLDAAHYLLLPELDGIRYAPVADDASQRRLRYLQDQCRQQEEEQFQGPPEAFLASLQMKFQIAPATEADLLRAEELTLRTNQLNSTGVTYSAAQLRQLMDCPRHQLLVCELQDKFGSYGKIGLVLTELVGDVLMIRLLLMSCRVAARGVGSVLLNCLMQQALAAELRLQADFRRTARNRQMLVTYQFAGFTEVSRDGELIRFEHPLSAEVQFPSYIHVEFQRPAAGTTSYVHAPQSEGAVCAD